jgi:hypothetical protein
MSLAYGKLLPIPPGQTISGWVPTWVEVIAPDIQEIISSSDVDALRERNEKLSSYLATLGIIRCAYAEQIGKKKAEYARANPPPDKGIKAWEAAADEALGETKNTYDLLTEIYESTAKRISVTQTNLRSRSSEASSIG